MQKICALSLSVVPVIGLALITMASPCAGLDSVTRPIEKTALKKIASAVSKESSKKYAAVSKAPATSASVAGSSKANRTESVSSKGSSVDASSKANRSANAASTLEAKKSGIANGVKLNSVTGNSDVQMPPKAPSRLPADVRRPDATADKPVSLASKPSASHEDANRVAVLNFDGPKIFDIDADEVWKIKTGNPAPGQGELIQIAGILQSNLSAGLGTRFGTGLVAQAEVAKAMMNAAPSVGSVQNQLQAARHMQARYLVTGSVDRVEFDGNTVLPDVYSLTVSMRIVDATTGQAVWSENAKKFTAKIYTKKSGKTVMQNFVDGQIPDVSAYFSTRVAQVLGR